MSSASSDGEPTTPETATAGPGSKESPTGRDASAERIIEAIQRPKQFEEPLTNATLDRILPPLELPGFGETQEDCGDPIAFFCDHCYRTVDLGRTCNQSTCTRCAAVWCRNRAENAVAYLKALRHVRYAETGRDQYFHHLVFSPPANWRLQAKNPLERTFKVIKRIAEELRIQGYAGFHPWSGAKSIEDDRGEWKHRLFEGRDWEGDVRSELTLRPHFHLIVVGDFVRGGDLSKRVEEETGWVLHRTTKRSDPRKSIGGDDEQDELEDLAAATSYAISHVGLKETAAGNMSAQWRNIGFRESDVEVFKQTREEARRVVRSVASKTLGIPSAQMQCEKEVPSDHGAPSAPGKEPATTNNEQAVSAPTRGVMDTRDLGRRGLLDLDNDSAGDFSDQMTPVDELDAETGAGMPVVDGRDPPGADTDDEQETTTCDGSLLIIAKAPQYIYDRRRDHPRLEDLEDLYEEWKEREDWIG